MRNQLVSLENDLSASSEEIFKLAQSFGEVLKNRNEDDIRFTIEELIDRIIIDNENIKIDWKFV